MPYVGFHPDIDPGHERAVKGGRKLRKWVMEVVPDFSMIYRLAHRTAEYEAHGRRLEASDIDSQSGLPNRVMAYGAATGRPLLVYYRTPWPIGPQPWPDIAPLPHETN